MTQRRPWVGAGASRRLPAGVADAALASLATFVTGLAAVNLLDDTARGVYAVFFTAFTLGAVIPTQLRYEPLAIVAVSHPRGERLAMLPRSLPVGLLIAAASTVVVIPAVLVTRTFAEPGLLFPMAMTCGATIFLSPTQDHVRRMLHVDGASWAAAVTSAVQLVTAVAVLAALYLGGVRVAWIPFGTLAIANLVSAAIGIVLARRRTPRNLPLKVSPARELWDLGSWLFVAAVVTGITTFVVASMMSALAGPEALGYAEAARVVAQPVIVLGVGLTAVLAPRVMESAIARDWMGSNRVIGGYFALLTLAATVFAVIAGAAWWFNPMAVLVPAAYVVPGLVVATVAANVLQSLLYVPTHELAAARKHRTMAVITLAASPLSLAAAATAGVTGAFARPVSAGVGAAAKGIAFHPVRRRYYGQPARPA